MTKWFTLAAIAVAIFVVTPGQRASAQTLDDTGLWFAASGNGEIESTSDWSMPLRWWFDAQYRLRDDSNGFNQSIIRPGLGVALTDEQVVWAGYAWINTTPTNDGENFDEHRFWQQWTAAPSVGEFRFLHRSRLEQRWVETGDDVGLRWRQLARAQRGLGNSTEWSLIAWDEVFFNFNDTDWGADGGLDQNRAFLGFGYNPNPDAPIRTEIGYLNQFINNQGGTDGMNHILSINFIF